MGNLGCAVVLQSLSAGLFLLCTITGVSLGTELNFVTCGSVIKLLNLKHNVRLHSHDVRYGSGEFPSTIIRQQYDLFLPTHIHLILKLPSLLIW